jgi:hypothetical protein
MDRPICRVDGTVIDHHNALPPPRSLIDFISSRQMSDPIASSSRYPLSLSFHIYIPTKLQANFASKTTARDLADASGVQCSPGSPAVDDTADAVRWAQKIGFPVILKPKGGGGGIGMQKCTNVADVESKFATASGLYGARFGTELCAFKSAIESLVFWWLEATNMCDSSACISNPNPNPNPQPASRTDPSLTVTIILHATPLKCGVCAFPATVNILLTMYSATHR